ncbi:NfeD family protein [Thalassotalea euphylliae]|uniref:NfeD family protein n=1 Tax=Thalassotalea euphylliae TaxID=1655234 RepID=A0A3E0TMC9_9GAMM|nr:NfeD family protein [Thalassotalea euphylliae]REL25430.1 NfeD family protein [Thalassotalea euphylliae]
MELIANNAGESLVTLGLLLLIIEVAVLGFSTFILTFIGLALLVAGSLVLGGMLPVQLMPIVLTTAILTTVFALILWKPLKRFQNRQDTHKVKNDFIGMEFVLDKAIDSSTSTTHKLSGIDWQVKAKRAIPAGAKVVVIDTEVGELWVEPA